MTSREARWNTLLDSLHGFLSFAVGPSAVRPRLPLRVAPRVAGRRREDLEANLRDAVVHVRAWRQGVVREWIGGGVLHHGVGQSVVVQGVTQAIFSR